MPANTITFRAITEDDEPFLFQLYASTREMELSQVPWEHASQKEQFLKMQFRAQHQYYQQQFNNADFDIVELHGEPIGRLYVEPRPDEIRIIDIALLPEYRRRGIGTWLLQSILDHGRQTGKPVRIHVEHFNPALSLYRRLGFNKISDTGVYYLMERLPDNIQPCGQSG